MFTGIVNGQGKLDKVEQSNSIMRARIICDFDMETVALGASISCDGVCLTVVACENAETGNWFDVDISAETMDVTSLQSWAAGNVINLERAMKLGDEIGGHLVSGHIDGMAEIVSIDNEGDNTVFTYQAPEALAKFIAPKGSVCLNGTSLTVNKVDGLKFTANLIPHTMQVTNWHAAKEGDKINLEIDMMARYVARLREFDA